MRKEFFLLFLFIACIAHAKAQPCSNSFSGIVVSEKGEPLPGASVLLEPIHKGSVTDLNGRFKIENLCAGTVSVTIQYLGYKTISTRLELAKSETRDFKLEPDAKQLEEIVVEEKPEHMENARNYVQLSEKQLAELAGKPLGEALREVSGVGSIQAGPGIFKPVIHGVHSQRVLILNHGVRQEGQQWGAEHAPEIDPFIASDITVIKDASSIKYGTDAIGGVVVVNPPALPVNSKMGGSFQTIAQSNGLSGTVAGMLEGGLGQMKGWGWRLQGSAKQSGDFHAPNYNLTNTALRERNFSTAVGYHRDRGGLEFFFSHFQTTVGILKGTAISSLDDLLAAMESDEPHNTSSFGYHIDEPRQVVSHDLMKVNGHVENGLGEWRAQYGFQNNKRQEFDIRRGGLSDLPAIDLQLFTHTLETEWESKQNNRASFCLGTTGVYQDNNNVAGTQRIPFIPNYNSLAGGAFGIANVYRQNLSFDLGARYDYKYYRVVGYDYKNTLYRNTLAFNNVSATAGVSVQGKHGQYSSSLSNAWRPPHVAELFSLGTHQSAAAIEYGLFLNDSTNEVMQRADVSFQNEKAVKWVHTYQRNWKRGGVELSAYGNYIFNYFYLRPTGITQNVRGTYPYFRYTQTNALFVGVDFTASWQAHPRVKISPKASLLRASDQKNNDYLVFIPPNRGELIVRYESKPGVHAGDFFFEVKGKYVFRQARAPRVITIRQFKEALETGADPLMGSNANFDFMAAPDGYFLLGASAGFTRPAKNVRFDFRASAENLLNTSYREYTNRFRYYADDLGRNIILSAKCIF